MNGSLSIDQPTRAARTDSMPAGRIVLAYFSEAKYEFLRLLRTPAFAVPILVLPVVVYLLFGVVMANEAITKNPAVGVFLFCGFSVFAVIGPGLLGVGISLALERDSGLLKLKRVLPAPPGAYILAKMLMAMVFATLTTASMIVLGVLIAKVALSAGQLAALAGVMILGTLPMCAMGLFIGAHTSGSAAPAFANLVFLPMMWLSGLFIPLPTFLQKWAVIWPAFHLNKLALAVTGAKPFSVMSVSLSVGVLVGVTVLLGGLAIRRLGRTG